MTKKEVCGSKGAAEELTEKEYEVFQYGAAERRRQRLNMRLANTNLPEVVKDKVRKRSGLWRAGK